MTAEIFRRRVNRQEGRGRREVKPMRALNLIRPI